MLNQDYSARDEKIAKLRNAIKKKDGWWASIFSGPLANRFLEPVCDIAWITPNLITLTSLFIGVITAFCFAQGEYFYLLIGGILAQFSFIVDCMDGQLARYRQQFSKLGAWLDRVSDRFKDFIYFFSLAWGFYKTHGKEFYIGWDFINWLLEQFITAREIFLLPVDLQAILMTKINFETWIIWPLAMIAMFTVLLIDYYVNQDMKLETVVGAKNKEEALSAHRADKAPNEKNMSFRSLKSFMSTFVKSILRFGLTVYRSIPILRFNIGEQVLLISIFTTLNSVFALMLVFAGLGSFYIIYWPIAKYYGFTDAKN